MPSEQTQGSSSRSTKKMSTVPVSIPTASKPVSQCQSLLLSFCTGMTGISVVSTCCHWSNVSPPGGLPEFSPNDKGHATRQSLTQQKWTQPTPRLGSGNYAHLKTSLAFLGTIWCCHHLRFHQNLKQLRHLHCVKQGGGLSPESPFIPAVTAQYQSPPRRDSAEQSRGWGTTDTQMSCGVKHWKYYTAEIQGNIKIFKNFQLSKTNPG